jgi:signal transduction histidine kinase
VSGPNKKGRNTGPSVEELRLRSELDRTRRELGRLKKRVIADAATAADAASAAADEAALVAERDEAEEVVAAAAADEARHDAVAHATAELAAALAVPCESAAAPAEVASLREQVKELTETRQRLSRLYFKQVEENRKRAERLHRVLQSVIEINAELDLDRLLDRIVETIRATLGFRIVLLRMREPSTGLLQARAFAGLDAGARAALEAREVAVDEFLGWLRDEFKVGHSYFISHTHPFSRELPSGHSPDLGDREEWEWHADDVLLVPLFDRTGQLVAYFSLDDPVDRLVPSSETVEIIEMFSHHAVVAIENARLVRELEQHSRDLEVAGQRMQELHALRSNFVSTVSHELRTPLTAIRAYVETLLAAGPSGLPADQTRRFVEVIDEESQRLARLIDSVLDLNRLDSGQIRVDRQSVDLAEVLEEGRKQLEPMAVAGKVTLKTVVELADTRMDADRDQIRQLVLHLGGNAVKFTPADGSVTLRLTGDARDVTLQVEDTGIGIPEDALERIFERFYQVDSSLVRRFGGVGLGLAICKSIVEWHGGRVVAESVPDRGSRFTVVLPRRTGPRVAVRPAPRPQAATDDVLRLAIEMVAEVMNARVVSLLAPEANGDLRIQAALGLDEAVVRDARIRPGQGVAGWVMEHRRPVCIAGGDAPAGLQPSGRRDYRTGTFLSVPLEGGDGLLGVLSVTDPIGQQPFDAEDCHLLLHLADRVAAAWEQARSLNESQENVDDTAQALRDVLQHLDRSRTRAPGRVRLARAVARRIGLDESEVGLVSFAASVHDVGMVHVGDELSGTAGSLTAEGRETLERHPELSAELLRPLETMGVVRDVILGHHEWWDGSGYPRGLAGGAIPVGSRILAVVDAWESITVGRPHRAAQPREQALEELRRLAGRQFDPEVVAAFEDALADMDHEDGTASTTDAAVTPHAGR